MMAELRIPDPVERDDLGAFVARAVRLKSDAIVRLRNGDDRVHAWVVTPFDTLVTRSVRGAVLPGDLTVRGAELLAAVAVVGAAGGGPRKTQGAPWWFAPPP